MHSYSPNPKLSSRRKPLLVACGLLAAIGLLMLMGIVFLFRSGSQSVAGAQLAADHFLSAVERQNYTDAYHQLSSQTQGTSTPDSIRDVMQVLQKRRGRVTGHTALPGWYINTYNGQTQVRLTYREQFQSGETTVQLQLSSQQGQWRVLAFNFQL